MPKYFDIHSHLNFPDYDKDLEEVIGRLRETETYTMVVGVDLESSKKAAELADKYPELYASIGIHPIGSKDSDISLFKDLAKRPKVVAMGECGLDFYHAKKAEDFERQKKLFLEQVEFAKRYDKPIMIHARNSYAEILEILEPMADIRGNIHFFAGTLEEAKRFINIGFTLSFTGVITFVRDYDEVIKNVPLTSIMSETDAPYVSPVPYRGKRNEPSFVSEVVKKIAEIRDSDFEEVRKELVQNALNMIR